MDVYILDNIPEKYSWMIEETLGIFQDTSQLLCAL
jgi:hypothetical protein